MAQDHPACYEGLLEAGYVISFRLSLAESALTVRDVVWVSSGWEQALPRQPG